MISFFSRRSKNKSLNSKSLAGEVSDLVYDRDPSVELTEKQKRQDLVLEVVVTVALALATLATAWSGYQAALWGGEQSTFYSQAGAIRTESLRASTKAGQQTQVDINLFSSWIDAFAEDNETLANFYESRFREEFQPAFDAWLATQPKTNPNAPKSPFVMEEYQLEKSLEADKLEVEAEQTFTKGQKANKTGDDYILNTVFLASVLFLSGIVTRFKKRGPRIFITAMGSLVLILGIYQVIALPTA